MTAAFVNCARAESQFREEKGSTAKQRALLLQIGQTATIPAIERA